MRVSVLMSVYNENVALANKAIKSILNQSFRDFEFIIIVDNPENTAIIDLIESKRKEDHRIRCYINNINIGLTKSLNKGLQFCTGDYIARMDADDISLHDRLQEQCDFLDKNPNVGLCSTNFSFIDDNDEILTDNVVGDRLHSSWLVLNNPIAHPSVMFRREILKVRQPLYNENYKYSQDIELWCYLVLHDINIRILQRNLFSYRVSPSQISHSHKKQQSEFSKQVHRDFIIGYLRNVNVIEGGSNVNLFDIVEKLDFAIYNGKVSIDCYIEKILLVIYYSVITSNFRYIFKYMFNRNLYVLRLPLKFSVYLLFQRIFKNKWKSLQF